MNLKNIKIAETKQSKNEWAGSFTFDYLGAIRTAVKTMGKSEKIKLVFEMETA